MAKFPKGNILNKNRIIALKPYGKNTLFPLFYKGELTWMKLQRKQLDKLNAGDCVTLPSEYGTAAEWFQ